MKKLIAYKTEVELTANIINDFSDSINKYIKGHYYKILRYIDNLFINIIKFPHQINLN